MRGDNRYQQKPKLVDRLASLERFTIYINSSIVKDAKGQHKNKGLFYAKGGAGIERNTASKRKPNDPYNINKVKGKMEPRRNLIVREKSKWEKTHPFTGN